VEAPAFDADVLAYLKLRFRQIDRFTLEHGYRTS